MKKRLLIVSIILVLIIVFFLLVSNLGNESLILTYCNDNYDCKVVSKNSTVDKLFRRYSDYSYVKIDKIINIKDITSDSLKNIIFKTSKNSFNNGIIFNDSIKLLSEEINANNILDYDNKKIDVNNLKKYLLSKNISINENELNDIKIFETNSYYKNKNMDNSVKLNLVNGFNILSYSDDDLDKQINASANRLLSMQQDNGSFIYGYRVNNGNIIKSYNILRHAGSVYSLIRYYDYSHDSNVKEKIEKSIDYLLKNATKKYNNDTVLVYEDTSEEIKLGGNALSLLMLSEYKLVFGDNRYDDVAKKIANGILLFQKSDGSLNHVLDLSFNLKDKYRTSYYDGEAAYGLLKYYEVSKNKKYYNSAKKIIDMFIKKNYTKYGDQWVSYSLNQFLKFNKDNKYIKFALDNYNKDSFDYITDFKPIKFELLTITLNTYNYIKNNVPNNAIIDKFDINALNQSIKYNKKILLGYYIDDTYSMYFNNSDKTKNGFFDLRDNFRMRIDDIQHSLTGLINYYFYS